MISPILILFAAVFNSIMDKTETIISFNNSVFRNLNQSFWCKVNSSEKPFFTFTKYRISGWHLAKSLMIILFALAIVLYQPIFNWCIDFLIVGMIWNITFNLCYNKLFKP